MSRRIFAFLPLLALAGLTAAPAAARPDDPGFLQFRGASFPVSEEAGEVTLVVKRHRGRTGPVTVVYTTADGTALDGEDYEAASGVLEWADGDRGDKAFTVPIFDDGNVEGVETFGVRLSDPTGDAELGALHTAVVRIRPSDRDDDSDSEDSDSEDEEDSDSEDEEDSDGDEPGIVRLTGVAFPAFESTGEAIVTIERAGGDDGKVSVDFATLDGSAHDGEDYLSTSGSLTWADGETGIKAVTVPLIDDEEPEGLETVSFILTHATGASLGGRDVASIVIIDDDGADGSCVPDAETLCLQGGRFQVTGTWRDFEGAEGPFRFVPSTDDSGLAWFFSESNVEVLIKVLNGCPLNGHFWVFFAASTNVGFTIEVTDLQAGVGRTSENPSGVVPLATTDVTAFATCP